MQSRQQLKNKYKDQFGKLKQLELSVELLDKFDEIEVAEDERAFVQVISSDAIDEDREVVLQRGLRWTYFDKTGGYVYMNHDYDKLPIGFSDLRKTDGQHTIAKTVLFEKPEGWKGEWLPDAIYAIAKQMADSGRPIGASIGFVPTEGRPATQKDIEEFGADVEWVWTKADVHEYSITAMPCNAGAIGVAKSMDKSDYLKQLNIKEESEEQEEPEEPNLVEMLTAIQEQLTALSQSISDIAIQSTTSTEESEESEELEEPEEPEELEEYVPQDLEEEEELEEYVPEEVLQMQLRLGKIL